MLCKVKTTAKKRTSAAGRKPWDRGGAGSGSTQPGTRTSPPWLEDDNVAGCSTFELMGDVGLRVYTHWARGRTASVRAGSSPKGQSHTPAGLNTPDRASMLHFILYCSFSQNFWPLAGSAPVSQLKPSLDIPILPLLSQAAATPLLHTHTRR